MPPRLTPGDTETISNSVDEERTAAAFAAEKGERFPAVLATPFLIADMERACARLLRPLLQDGQLSVGAHIDVRHMAPTGVGGAYRATATFIEEKPPLYWFEVLAEDSAGVIGRGRIARAIVSEAAILERAKASSQS